MICTQEELRLERLRNKANKLPLSPGVYIMKNKAKKIIYIGKAKKLKNRVSQYFGSQNKHSIKVRKMVENVDDFDYILTDSEFEALVLECSLIKQNMPKYNILLKDAKGYSYIRIDGGAWGNISAVFRKKDDGAQYIGPYMGNYSVTNVVEQAKEIFLLPSCNKKFPRDINKSSRPCLNYFIKKCSAPCVGKITLEQYNENLNGAIEFVKSSSAQIIKRLEAQMLEASENLEFEKAARIRDRIRAIERITSRQKVVVDGSVEEDVFAIAQRDNKSCCAVLSFRQGLLVATEHFILDSLTSLEEMRSEIIMAYYSKGRQIPPLIVVDGEIESKELIEQYLTMEKGRKVQLLLPQRGQKVRVMEMCLQNGVQKLSEYHGKQSRDTAVLDELKKTLGLKKVPEYIESYDISHTAGSDNVAGMIVFKNARPYKKAYKRFAIKGFDGQDDYGSMKEVISRRLNRYVESEDKSAGFGRLPDLILLDGGQGQVNAVKPIIEAFGLDIPVFGMVKDSKHRTRAIAEGGREISLTSGRNVFTLVSEIQEEVHRFAISYHKQKHTKGTVSTSLTAIEGIGEKKASILLKHFKTLSKIKGANVSELCEVKGISKKDAEKIFNWFQNKK